MSVILQRYYKMLGSIIKKIAFEVFSRLLCNQSLFSTPPAEQDCRVRSFILPSLPPVFRYADVLSAMSAHSANFISLTGVCHHVTAERRHALYVGSDMLTRSHTAISFLRKIINAKGLRS
jgi:hypothetical protein